MTIKYWVVDLTIYKEKCIPTEEIIDTMEKAAKSIGMEAAAISVTGPVEIEEEEE